ncbi:MAG: TetR/AcrR family transcriptional regulator [Chloroflexi bacterium]|nr:TetR/AcrR family transcriptional regulator [Chloroflexota bacterium]
MTDKKLDRRVQRTRQALKDALIRLIPEQGYESITVADITSAANVNRATLYMHYRDKNDLLLRMIDDELAAFASELEPPDPSKLNNAQPSEPLVVALRHIAGRADFYRVMFGSQGVAAVAVQVRHTLAAISTQRLQYLMPQGSGQSAPVEISAHFAAGALIGVISWWLENDQPVPPEHLSRYLMGLIAPAMYASIGLTLPQRPPDAPSSGD